MRHRSRGVLSATEVLVLCAFLTFGIVSSASGAPDDCCVGTVGNVDCSPDDLVDVADLTAFIDHLFFSFGPLCCPGEANCDADPEGSIDIGDLTAFIRQNYITFDAPPACAGGLTFAQRSAVFNAVDSAYEALEGNPLDTIAARLAAFLNTLPEIDSAGVIDSVSVWAWFTDGRMISIPNNRFPEDTIPYVGDWSEPQVETQPPAGFVIPPRRFPVWDERPLPVAEGTEPSASRVVAYELPQSLQTHVFSSLGAPCFPPTVAMVTNLLESRGYVCATPPATVTNLLAVDSSGLFYIDAHGGPGIDRSDNRFLSIWTASAYTAPNEAAFASMLGRDELVYMKAKDRYPETGACLSHWRYAFTDKFVAQYMSFVPHSLIFINACEGDSVPSLREGFKLAGASVFCGWTKTVKVNPSNKAADYMFDRLLGTNASTWVAVENPPQRPFDVDLLWTDMKNRGLDTDPSNQSKFRVRHLQDSFGFLAPSVRNLAIVEHFDTLYVLGMFGTDPGEDKRRVLVGGTDMLVYEWQPWIITCFIPNTGAGSVGPVSVEVDGLTGPSSSIKRRSNEVNLTEWRGQLTYTMADSGSLLGTIAIQVHLRADIHKFRDAPHQAPQFYSIIFPASEDSYGTATVTGQYSYEYPESDPLSIDTWTWTGSRPLSGLWEQDPYAFQITGQVDPGPRILKLRLNAAENRDLTETLVNNLSGWQYTEGVALFIPFELYDVFPSLFYMSMDNTWSITGSQRTVDLCCSHFPENPGVEDVRHKLAWPTITASFPPDSTHGQ